MVPDLLKYYSAPFHLPAYIYHSEFKNYTHRLVTMNKLIFITTLEKETKSLSIMASLWFFYYLPYLQIK